MNIYKRGLKYFLFFLLTSHCGQAQYFEWANIAVADSSLSNFAQLNVEGTYIDKSGNSYYTGSRIRCMSCNTEAYIAKVNADGTPGFELNLFFDFSTPTTGRSIIADDSGNVYVSGFCSSNVTFYSTPIFGTNSGYFLAKLDATGNLTWCRAINSMGYLSLNHDNEIYISDDNLTNSFIEKLSYIGDSLWQIPYGAKKIKFNHSNCFYSLTQTDIKKFDGNGMLLWAKDSLGGGNDFTMSCGEDLYIVNDSSVFKIDKNGNTDWSNTTVNGSYIAVDTTDRIFIAGNTNIYELENDGSSKIWEKTIIGGNFRSVAIHPQNKLYLPVYWHVDNNPLIIFPFEFLQSPFSTFDDKYMMLASLNLDTVNIPQQVLITTGNCDPMSNGFCRGTSFSVSYNTFSSNFDSSNTFVVELIDGLGNVMAIGTPDSCIVPFSTPSGVDYRIRVRSTSPAYTSSLNKDGNLWVHDNEPVLLTVGGNNSICQGDSVLLSASPTGIGVVYVWKLDSNWFFNPTSSFYASATGTYEVTILQSFGTCFSNTNAENIVVHALPSDIDFTGLPDTMCNYNAPIILISSPSGGIYSGAGVIDSIFDPASALLGLNSIVYTYTDSFSCSASMQHDVYVDVCLGVNAITGTNSLTIYPNPCSDYLQVDLSGFVVNNSQRTSIRISDISGKTVYSNQVNGVEIKNNFIINTHNFSKGIYTCELISGASVVRKQFSVIR